MASQHFSRQRGPLLGHGVEQTIRAQLGLTQQELARLLGVSRTALAMAELGQRDLPPGATQRLLHLGQALATTPSSAVAVLTAGQRGALELRLQAIRLEEQPLRQQLSRVQIQLDQARRRQQAEPMLRASLPASDALAHRWLSRFSEEADALLRAEGATPALLELKLRVLAAEQAEIEQLLGKPAVNRRAA